MPSNPVVAVRYGVIKSVEDYVTDNGKPYAEAEIHFSHKRREDGNWDEEPFVDYQRFFFASPKNSQISAENLIALGATNDGESWNTSGESVMIAERRREYNGKFYPEYSPFRERKEQQPAGDNARALIAAAFAQANALQEANAPNTAPAPPPPPPPAAAASEEEKDDTLPF